ncbi:13187_t:CDS:2 [Ambispora leptoticha]|uniref:13187_t:CDS:1 n=1 Tax=Ambispora leptoticha TaxID=144679 RepID=A0A9N8VUE1_9GLOM|nr:13187_t:CDS:2 [Ambispora leptoticha]
MSDKQPQTKSSSQAAAGSSFFKGIIDFFADTTKNAQHDFVKFKEGISLGFLVQQPDQQRTMMSGESEYFTDSRASLHPKRHRKRPPVSRNFGSNFQKSNNNSYKPNSLKQHQSDALEIERERKYREKELWRKIEELNQKVALLEKIVSELRADHLNNLQSHSENYHTQYIPSPPPPPPVTPKHESSLTTQALISLRNNLKTTKNQEKIKTTTSATKIESNKCHLLPQQPSPPKDMTALLEDLKNVKLRRTNLLRSTSGYISSISTPNSEQGGALVCKHKFPNHSQSSLSSSLSTISIDYESTYNNLSSSSASTITCQSDAYKDLESFQNILNYPVKRQKI